ncbi:uncharacterized protein LOC141914665 [Tubulanus polymorphus]|uniref:uncharacterized protein LOC141914665 n=1 Tax=Tubulanus polymorphus TaxID=672921 RepID=UPI003DA6A6FB
MQATTDPAMKERIKSLRQTHYDQITMDRQAYTVRRNRAKANPQRYTSLIIDGMDQKKTYIPHLTGSVPKEFSSNELLKTHVTGVICHAMQRRYCYLDVLQYPHDSNMVMNVLLKTLWKESVNGHLPPILYLQADNTCRENKNRYLLAFLELFVRLGICHETNLSFLSVGHTHEDVDQMFSVIAGTLRKEEALTLDAMLQKLIGGQFLNGLFDIRAWLEPHIRNISGHSKIRNFCFRKTEDGCSLFYRKSSSGTWRQISY